MVDALILFQNHTRALLFLLKFNSYFIVMKRTTHLPSYEDNQVRLAVPKYTETNGLVRSSTDSTL